MSDEQVQIEVDGRTVAANKGEMLIAATDRAGIYIPRFCYHKNLSVAANCRMCLVEVERAPKPLPACATPVSDGMKVFTRSEKAIDAQQGTMEFLLINHPLDCPICDQGGECELQDLAMGYGSDVSRYTERKRVVRDKEVGALIKTDMTRCIHCTRCVRFGEEIAGLRELGATGRGEHMEIGTYIERSIHSELSGNIIDLCPVGALTNKPYRYSARAWELRAAATISPHDCVGTNIQVHFKGRTVKRVVPQEHVDLNQTWIADRDRYSVHALNSDDRLLTPRIKRNNQWLEVSWAEAIDLVIDAINHTTPEGLAAVLSPSSTNEEALLFARLFARLGSKNLDYRIRQQDFRDDGPHRLPGFLGRTFDDLERAQAIFVIEGNPRYEQPVLNIRLRKAALAGARVYYLSSVHYPTNYDVAETFLRQPADVPRFLGDLTKDPGDEGMQALVNDLTNSDAHIILGEAAASSATYADIRGAAFALAQQTGASIGELTAGANSIGLGRAGVTPFASDGAVVGKNALEILSGQGLDTVFLHGFEPDQDSISGSPTIEALAAVNNVIVLSAFQSDRLDQYSSIQLPIAPFTENEGSYTNCVGDSQEFRAAVPPQGEAKPAWKILRLMGGELGLEGFEFATVDSVSTDFSALPPPSPRDKDASSSVDLPPVAAAEGLPSVRVWPMYSSDPVVRRSQPLQATIHAGDTFVHLHPATAGEHGVADLQEISIELTDPSGTTRDAIAVVKLGTYIAPGTVMVYAGAIADHLGQVASVRLVATPAEASG